MRALVEELGALGLFYRDIFRSIGQKGLSPRAIHYLGKFGFQAIGVTIYGGVFLGAILSLQFYKLLEDFGGASLVGGLNTSGIVRQVGPLVVAILLSGKIGAYTAAELATMKVTDQIDALKCSGLDVSYEIVVPRFLGIFMASLLLLFLGLVSAIIGGYLCGSLIGGLNFYQYTQAIPRFVGLESLWSGFFKGLLFSLLIAGVSCFHGLRADYGAIGVGKTVTRAATMVMVLIVVVDWVSTELIQIMRVLAS
jgi:phospholipid/cholesterol/gamma-HCH transport system permease protein